MHSKTTLIKLLLRNGHRDPGQIATYLEIRHALSGCETVLDVGCGTASVLRLFGFTRLVGVEGHQSSADKARSAGTHDEIILADARKLENYFDASEFDACVALDVIEHLPKNDGQDMIRSMEHISAKKTVFLTPNGFLRQSHIEDKDLQEHLSGWDAGEMQRSGYIVTGILGPKSLRGKYHMLIRRPKLFWGVISLLGHILYTRARPEKAAAILCIKSA